MARDGDHLITPFQCDYCLFVMLTSRAPLQLNRQDALLQCCIRRANLDAFWGRESSTVLANRRNLNQLLSLWDSQVGIPPNALPPLGPYPNHDLFGVSVAVGMLLKSLQPGRYRNYCQFETIRKLRSAYSNVYHASIESAQSSMTLGRDTAKAYLTTCPTQSMWFERFVKGLLRRMGQEVRQDLAVSIPVMLALQDLLEEEWQNGAPELRATATYVGAYALSAFGAALRGHEVFLVDLFGLRKYMSEKLVCDGQPYVLLPLLGRFKREDGERYHLTPLAAKSSSGLNFKLWLSRLVDLRVAQGASHGPAFADSRGVPLSSRWLEQELLDRLFRIQAQQERNLSLATMSTCTRIMASLVLSDAVQPLRQRTARYHPTILTS